MFGRAMASGSTMEWECTLKKLRELPHVFRNPLRLAVREPITVVIQFDHLRKKTEQ
jgi:hypothetical protein